MFKEPVINVYIPYEPEKRLGAAYNRIIKESAYEYNLLLDWDVIILNPNWYDICQQVILYLERESKCIGLIGAVTNYLPKHITPHHIGDACQISLDCPKNNDIDLHIKHAHYLHNKYRETIQQVCSPHPLGGFFMLINKTAWSALGGFREAYECDLDYSLRLHNCGFEQYIIPGLYVYHACGQDSIFSDSRGFDRGYISNESGHIEILRQRELEMSKIMGILRFHGTRKV